MLLDLPWDISGDYKFRLTHNLERLVLQVLIMNTLWMVLLFSLLSYVLLVIGYWSW